MMYKRAIKGAIGIYLATFLLSIVIFFLPWVDVDPMAPMSLSLYVYIWILYVPIILLGAKWYFKALQPTVERGFLFGLVIIAVSLLLDGVFFVIGYASGQGTDTFIQMYTDWKFFATILLVIVLCTLAGVEFDGTYSKKK